MQLIPSSKNLYLIFWLLNSFWKGCLRSHFVHGHCAWSCKLPQHPPEVLVLIAHSFFIYFMHMVDYKFFIGIAIPQFRHHSSMASPTRRLSCDEWNGKFNTAMQSECMQHVYLNYFHTWIDENQRNQWALHRHLLNALYYVPPPKVGPNLPIQNTKKEDSWPNLCCA